MKKITLLLLAAMFFACQTPQESEEIVNVNNDTIETNDFYDDAPQKQLESDFTIQIGGEVASEMSLDLSEFPVRSVLFKNTRFTEEGGEFVGAYEFHGVSLYDILNEIKVDKANEADYSPIIDLYVTIENAEGDFAVFSWGEIYYAANQHQIIIANAVNPIVPSKTKDQWPLPEKTQLIPALDLFTDRMIENPTKISVHSCTGEFPEFPETEPLFAESFELYNAGEFTREIKVFDDELTTHLVKNTFYGRGRGIHGITDFEGKWLKDVIAMDYPYDVEALKHGIFIIASVDGYRAVFSFSEIMNRNDQSEVMLNDRGDVNGGKFRLFVPSDFFSDRAVKSVSKIEYRNLANK
ncbi:MAG: hypothetical protein PF448_12355 [Bacteroidales bacterium]|jgi:hypothetical protein|nr:hypothetical protein [Bacteroidales bacterium]